MALIVGLLLIILGSVALWAWFSSVIIFIKGMVVFSLLLWGLVSLLIGYASWKAKSHLKAALERGDDSGANGAVSKETLPPTT